MRRTITEVNEGWQRVLDAAAEEAEDGPPASQVRVLALMINACNRAWFSSGSSEARRTEWKRARELFIQSALAATSHTRA